MKKITSILLVCLMATSLLISPVSASSLDGLGIVDLSYSNSQSVTRAAFAEMVVAAAGKSDEAIYATSKNLFSDVPATHAQRGEINLAYQLGYMTGKGNGNFSPNAAVTLGEAVGTALLMLGYTTQDIGSFWPTDHMNMANSLGLLDGISKTVWDSITYSDASILFSNLLNMQTKEGKEYLSTIASTTVQNAIVLDTNAQNGTNSGMLKVYSDGKISYYEQAQPLSNSLELSEIGTLLLDEQGRATAFVGGGYKAISLSPSEVQAGTVYDAEGTSYTVPSGAALIIGDKITTYGMEYYELESYSEITLLYGENGQVEAVYASAKASTEGYALTVYYESAYPNPSAPESITALGLTLDVSSEAQSDFTSLAIGDKITLILDADGEVAQAMSASSSASADMVGILGEDSVTLSCGLVLKGNISTEKAVGSPVRVSASSVTSMSVYSASNAPDGTLDTVQKTLDGVALATTVTIYDTVKGQAATEVTLGDISIEEVDEDQILYYHINSQGLVDIIILDDVTGLCYTYGIFETATVTTNSGSFGTIENTTVAIKTSNGTEKSVVYGLASRYNDLPGGIVYDETGEVLKTKLLDSADDIERTAFDGTETVVADGVRYDIAQNVQVYNTVTDSFTTLELAKSASETFSVCYDEQSGKVFMIYCY